MNALYHEKILRIKYRQLFFSFICDECVELYLFCQEKRSGSQIVLATIVGKTKDIQTNDTETELSSIKINA